MRIGIPSVPVIADARSEAAKATSSATSSGLLGRCVIALVGVNRILGFYRKLNSVTGISIRMKTEWH